MIKNSIFGGFAAVLALTGSVQAQGRPQGVTQDVPGALFALGEDLCRKSLTGDLAAFDASDFAQALKGQGPGGGDYDRGAFCGCVGDLFRDEGDAELLSDIGTEIIEDDSYFTLSFTLFDHMSSCLPEGASVGLGIDLGLDDEDLNAALDFGSDNPQALPVDEGDIAMCHMALDGDLPVPGGGMDEKLVQAEAKGMSRDELCTCTAEYLASLGADFVKEVETSSHGNVIYASTLAGGMEQCSQ